MPLKVAVVVLYVLPLWCAASAILIPGNDRRLGRLRHGESCRKPDSGVARWSEAHLGGVRSSRRCKRRATSSAGTYHTHASCKITTSRLSASNASVHSGPVKVSGVVDVQYRAPDRSGGFVFEISTPPPGKYDGPGEPKDFPLREVIGRFWQDTQSPDIFCIDWREGEYGFSVCSDGNIQPHDLLPILESIR